MRFSQVCLYFVASCIVLVSLAASGQVINITIAPNGAHPSTTAGTAQAHATDSKPPTGTFMTIFGGEGLMPKHRNPNVNYVPNSGKERFVVYVPENYTGATPYGLVVFIDRSDTADVPLAWKSILRARNLMFVAAQNSGNELYSSSRMGLAVLGALGMMKHYRIDPSRVYVSGFSGGARIAGKLGFFQPDLFHATIQIGGADFYRPVAKVYATSFIDNMGNLYGIFQATTAEVEAAKRVRFVLITGGNDFRRGNILDVFNGGFSKSGINSKLIDVPGLGHEICDGQTFSAALDFIEGAERH